MINTKLLEEDKFRDTRVSQSSRKLLNLPDADVILYRNFFDEEESKKIFSELLHEVKWRQEKIKLFGKEMNVPRLTAWYGDKQKYYTYSGILHYPQPWFNTLLRIKAKIDGVEKVKFNSVLLNLYRHGQDGMSWHSDDEPELGKNPLIGSVSFGGTRKFKLKHRIRNI